MLTTNVSLKLKKAINMVKIGDSYKTIKITDQCKNWMEDEFITSLEPGLYKRLILKEIKNDIVLDVATDAEEALNNKYAIICGYVKEHNWNTDLLISEGSDKPIILKRYNGMYSDNINLWDIFFLKLEGDTNIQAQLTAKKHIYVTSKKDEQYVNMSSLTDISLIQYNYIESLCREFGKFNTEQDIKDYISNTNIFKFKTETNRDIKLYAYDEKNLDFYDITGINKIDFTEKTLEDYKGLHEKYDKNYVLSLDTEAVDKNGDPIYEHSEVENNTYGAGIVYYDKSKYGFYVLTKNQYRIPLHQYLDDKTITSSVVDKSTIKEILS